MLWADLAMIIIVALLTTVLLVFLEERMRKVPNVSVDRPADVTAVTATGDTRHNEYILVARVLGIAVSGGIIFLRLATSFFQEMKRYLVFDILLLMGTLILPWLSAIPVFLADSGLVSHDGNRQPSVPRAG